jgi:hypothetical protein
MLTRRELLQFGASLVWVAQTVDADGTDAPRPPSSLHRWCPQFPPARELWVVPFTGDLEEGMLLESAAGLAAHAALHGNWRTLIYEDLENTSYQHAFAAYKQARAPQLLHLSLDEVVERLHKAGIAQGYLLYRADTSARALYDSGELNTSVNAATTLASFRRGLLVGERLEQRMQRLGLPLLRDVRQLTEVECLQQESGRLSREALGTCDPKARNVRSLMIAMGTFVCSGTGAVYRQGLARCRPDVPVIGWGCAAEDAQTIPSSRYGLFQTATNWCHNLPVFASESVNTSIPPQQLSAPTVRHWSELDWGDGNHYATFVLSDGDNVQWEMGNYVGGSEASYYYGNPQRGKIPFGWGVAAPSLVQVAPRILADIFGRATPNDDFILFCGGGYFYPDLYGKEPGRAQSLQLHAERLRGYMELTGVRTLAFNFQRWDSPDAQAACTTLASHLPGLQGILAFQYYPYSAGNGAIYWARGAGGEEVPVISCRLCIWAQTGRERETTPAGVAAWLNKMPTLGASATTDNFSWVLTHAWSRFHAAPAGASLLTEERDVSQDHDAPDSVRGYTSALWAAERLAPHVKLVTPQEWLLRLRLRLRPQATLGEWYREARTILLHHPEATESHRLLVEADRLLPQTGRDNAIARQCYEHLKAAVTLSR